MPSQTTTEPQRRAQALDALRGFAILMMVLSGVVPAAFPAWMHHAQCPPPTLEFNPNIPGITWVDLVFPYFIFSMGAAIPLALSRRIEKGEPWWRLAWGVLQRFVLLGLFAAYVEHIRPFSVSSEPTWKTWTFGLVAFAALLVVLVRFPAKWPRVVCGLLRAAGWAAAIGLMFYVRRADGSRFDVHNNDIIILILANVVLGVSVVWLLTRTNLLLRLGSMGLLLAVQMSAQGGNWLDKAWNWSPEAWLFQHHLYFTAKPWLFETGMLRYLFIAVPGTIVGDILLRWLREERGDGASWSVSRWWSVTGVSVALTPVLLWGLLSRHVWQSFLASIVLCAVAVWLVSNARLSSERIVREIVSWGVFWLILGLLFEPYEGGIKKDPATMSYYFVCAGLACFTLIAFTAVMDALKKPAAMRLLADNGQNPMLAYVGLSNIVQPVLFLTGINPLINKWAVTPGREFVHGAVATLLVALVVSAFTRARLFLRT